MFLKYMIQSYKYIYIYIYIYISIQLQFNFCGTQSFESCYSFTFKCCGITMQIICAAFSQSQIFVRDPKEFLMLTVKQTPMKSMWIVVPCMHASAPIYHFSFIPFYPHSDSSQIQTNNFNVARHITIYIS